MNQFDGSVGLAGALVVSLAAYAALRRVQRSDRAAPPRRDRLDRLDLGLPGLLPHPGSDDAMPETRPLARVRQAATEGRVRRARPTLAAVPEPGVADILPLIGTMQWDRALLLLERLAGRGEDLGPVAARAEAAVLERLRGLPESDLRLGFGGHRLLAALVPANPVYAERVGRSREVLEARRAALLAGLTRDDDRLEPGTVWLNHPWNPRFDDVRRPIWLYIGSRADGRPTLRLRTHWLGDFRIATQGIEVIHDGMAETLTSGPYKIDADALGWEWRDEPADMYQIEVLRSLVGAGEVTLRYQGDPWPCEAPLSEDDKRAVAEMIELYDLMMLSAPLAREALAA
jgi:hypothetical protein